MIQLLLGPRDIGVFSTVEAAAAYLELAFGYDTVTIVAPVPGQPRIAARKGAAVDHFRVREIGEVIPISRGRT